MADVFISYAHDDEDAAILVEKALSERGWSVFRDRDDLLAGEDWELALERELDAARCVVVLWSRASVASKNVRDEARAVVDRAILIPVLIESDVKIPMSYAGLHWVDLDCRTEDFVSSEGFQQLVRAVKKRVNPSDKLTPPRHDESATRGVEAPDHKPAARRQRPKSARTKPGLPTPAVTLGVPQLEYNVMLTHPSGLLPPAPGMRIRITGTVRNATGKTLQLVSRFFLSGVPVMANPQETILRDMSGCVAAATSPTVISANATTLDPYVMAIPYYALNLMHTFGAVTYSLAVTVTAYLDNVAVAQSAAAPFWVRW